MERKRESELFRDTGLSDTDGQTESRRRADAPGLVQDNYFDFSGYSTVGFRYLSSPAILYSDGNPHDRIKVESLSLLESESLIYFLW